MEKEDYVKISFRSRGSFAVNDFSKKYFNGGGHRNASGGESYASLKETVDRFTSLLESYREQLTADED
jgi:phosphoesterase RecJ-like protein